MFAIRRCRCSDTTTTKNRRQIISKIDLQIIKSKARAQIFFDSCFADDELQILDYNHFRSIIARIITPYMILISYNWL